MSSSRSALAMGKLLLKNPVIAAAGEHLQTASGVRAALMHDAAVVVAKSMNETSAARMQLARADYRMLDAGWHGRQPDFQPALEAGLLNRSGLIDRDWRDWLAEVGELDREASQLDAYVAASIVLADPLAGQEIARQAQQEGIRIFEFNIGAPYGDEAAVVTTERSAKRVFDLVQGMRQVLDRTQLWVKLTSQSENPALLAKAARDAGADAVILIGRPLGLLPDLETQTPVLNTNCAWGGRWALPLTCYWLARARRLLGPDYPLIATNGARDGGDVARMVLAGARAVEMCSAVMLGGFGVLKEAVASVESYLASKDATLMQIVGKAADSVQPFQDQPVSHRWRDFIPPEAR